MIRKLYADEPRSRSRHTTTLPLILLREREAGFIIRIRTVHDFEYEETIADINRKLVGVETILLFTEPELNLHQFHHRP